jgi:hypothetical protein
LHCLPLPFIDLKEDPAVAVPAYPLLKVLVDEAQLHAQATKRSGRSSDAYLPAFVGGQASGCRTRWLWQF